MSPLLAVSWATVATLATAVATVILAIATFSSVRSANRTARAAERSLLAGTQPVMVASRPTDPVTKIVFADDYKVIVDGGRASAEVVDDAIYLTMPLRNVGPGLGILDSWHISANRDIANQSHADPSEFRRLTRDLYVPAGDLGFWQGAIRGRDDPDFAVISRAVQAGDPLTIDLLYSDSEGGQRTITRIRIDRQDDAGPEQWYPRVARHWYLDRPDPR